MTPLSVIVITKNEERNLAFCLESVSWADDIVVVDAASTDATVAIAGRYTSKVFVEEWLGFSAAKTFAMSHTAHEWVLWLDADERVTPDLAGDIRRVVAGGHSHAAFRMPRRSYFLGRWIRHCGWYPGHVTRLFRKSSTRFSDSKVHEYAEISGTTGTLEHDLLHFTDDNLEHYFSKFNRYTTLAAGELADAGRRATWVDLLLRPAVTFLKMYVLKAGFMDGFRGFILCRLSAAYVFTKYAKRWEAQQDRHDA